MGHTLEVRGTRPLQLLWCAGEGKSTRSYPPYYVSRRRGHFLTVRPASAPPRQALRRELSERFVDAGQLPVVPLSAAEGRGVGQLMPEVVQLYRAWNTRCAG